MQTIKIMDPVTRIEGHMKVEITIDGNSGQYQVTDARCTGTLFRGFETLLKGRKPIDATVITQRICGVCPISHGQGSVLALENVSEWLPPHNARLLRNLTLGANFIQSHILHFYLLAALDFAKGPAKPPWTPVWTVDLRNGLDHIAAHLQDALEARRQAHELGALLGGRMPTSHAYIPGGFTANLTNGQINTGQQYLSTLLNFIETIYIPDVKSVGDVYPDYLDVGKGSENLMAFGVFEEDNTGGEKFFRSGYAEKGSNGSIQAVNTSEITESVSYSWYADNTDNLNPASGDTQPQYPKDKAYSWLKAPRLLQKPFEVGPLARMWINGDYRQGVSVLDRHLARAYEAKKIAGAMQRWLNDLGNGECYDDGYEQYAGFGFGLTEAPRGALGHWVKINTEGRIEHYQIITPTCWNASPRDGNGIAGPMEQALIGMPIKDPEQPVEALRVIHSFDPCLSCAVHMSKPNGEAVVVHTGCR